MASTAWSRSGWAFSATAGRATQPSNAAEKAARREAIRRGAVMIAPTTRGSVRVFSPGPDAFLQTAPRFDGTGAVACDCAAALPVQRNRLAAFSGGSALRAAIRFAGRQDLPGQSAVAAIGTPAGLGNEIHHLAQNDFHCRISLPRLLCLDRIEHLLVRVHVAQGALVGVGELDRDV